MRMKNRMAGSVGLFLWVCFSTLIRAQNAATPVNSATHPGDLIIDPPTLICLGFMWNIKGDSNVNAVCSIQYRKRGETKWLGYLPLCRTGKGRQANYGYGGFGDPNHNMRYTIPNGFAGSIMDLEPDTEYEVRLEISDPDGVTGEAVRQITARTRPEPTPYAQGEVRHVYPQGHTGDMEQPAYRSIMHAVNGFNPWCDNYQTVHPNKAKPGTVVKVHAGVYASDRFDYRKSGGAGGPWLTGLHKLVASGEADKPIAIVAAGDGEVIIDGAECHELFDIRAADYLYFEGLTIRNTFIAFHAGFQGERGGGAKGLAVKRCKIENVSYGVLAQDGRSSDFYIADNIILGKNAPDQFHPTAGGASGQSAAGYAVNLSGTGHVVCHNYCAQFWDTLNVFTNALADPTLGQQALAIDFYNNDIHNTCDNFIETDGSMRNVRVLRNRNFNCIATPLSWQPVYQGPVYWIRNVVYNATGGTQAFKAAGGDNIIAYHNTFSGSWSAYEGTAYGDFRNNLFAGPAKALDRKGSGDRVPYLKTGCGDSRSIFDHNAYRAPEMFENAFQLRLGDKQYSGATLAELSRNGGPEQHGVGFDDYGIFVNAAEPNHALDKTMLYYAPDVDLRPGSGAPVVDAGCVLPGVNDDFDGKAPDIGAYEAGQAMPIYGPRDPELQKAVAQRIEDIKAGKITYAPSRQSDAAGESASSAASLVPAEGPVVGKSIEGVVDADKDGIIEGILAGGKTIPISGLLLGKGATDSPYDPTTLANFNLLSGIPGNSSKPWNLDMTDFGGGAWSNPKGEGPDFFVFEAGGNDDMFISALLADGKPGKPIRFDRSAWRALDYSVSFAIGKICGIAISVTDLPDAEGKALTRDAVLEGIRLTGTGMDPVSVCAVKPDSL